MSGVFGTSGTGRPRGGLSGGMDFSNLNLNTFGSRRAAQGELNQLRQAGQLNQGFDPTALFARNGNSNTYLNNLRAVASGRLGDVRDFPTDAAPRQPRVSPAIQAALQARAAQRPFAGGVPQVDLSTLQGGPGAIGTLTPGTPGAVNMQQIFTGANGQRLGSSTSTRSGLQSFKMR